MTDQPATLTPIQEVVRERYAEAARRTLDESKTAACCEPDCCGTDAAAEASADFGALLYPALD
ncbi:MAG TPA: hypothetical protein VK831_06175, partial [Candidatus Deferrimicrobiaceae bacterium]|nr:hypothetical protein [Candidatus Deferrimicrobiaceae bacterium]